MIIAIQFTRCAFAAIITLFVVALLLPCTSHAQDIPSVMGGTTYVIAFPDTTRNTFDARYPNNRYEDKAFFFIYSAVDNVISIKGRGLLRSGVVVGGGKFIIIDLLGTDSRAPAPFVDEDCKPVDNTFRIEAASPIIVYQYMATKFGTEAWTPLPVEAWGTEYYAAAHPGEVGSDVSPGGQFDY
ncbi:MAG: hypothetical protein H7X80_11085, partial [bacterium]|nr:hypothetical protein [Candidatus Kapabacteria bacterium]